MSDKQPPHVEQALAESASTSNDEQKKAAQKRLDAAGYVRATRAQAADAEVDDKDKASRAPQGRRAPGKQQA
jgi:hypothetical protein